MQKIFIGLAIAACVVAAGCATPAAGELPPLRRIVTVENADGSARVLADDAGSNINELNGSRIVRLWETSEMPVPLAIDRDVGASAGNAYRDGFVGSSLYVAEIPPGSGLDDIPIHRQDSLDYIAVLEGEIELVLPDSQLTMRRGDILVQGGNLHSWVNDSDADVRLLVVVLTGTRD